MIMENQDETVQDTVEEENLDLPEETEEGEEDTTDWKSEAQKLREKAIAQRERTKLLKKERDELKKAVELTRGSDKKPNNSNQDGLDENALDFLDLKGYTEDEDIELIENVISKTGQTVRQVLKDDYVKSKLEANKQARDAKNATPSSTKRSGSQANTLEMDMAKFEQTGEYPEDFERRSAVVNKLEERDSVSIPAYRK